MKKIAIMILIISVFVFAGCGKVDGGASIQTGVESKIEDIAVNLVTDMSKGEFDKAVNEYHYDPDMLKVMNKELLETQLWGYFTDSFGLFVEIEGFTVSSQQGYDVVSVKTIFENEKININIVFDADELIAGINYTLLQ